MCVRAGHGPGRPFLAPLLANERLTPAEHDQDTRLLVLGLAGSGLAYAPGDIAAVLPAQPRRAVAALLARLGLDGEDSVRVEAADAAAPGAAAEVRGAAGRSDAGRHPAGGCTPSVTPWVRVAGCRGVFEHTLSKPYRGPAPRPDGDKRARCACVRWWRACWTSRAARRGAFCSRCWRRTRASRARRSAWLTLARQLGATTWCSTTSARARAQAPCALSWDRG
jgi:hypothetical protein